MFGSGGRTWVLGLVAMVACVAGTTAAVTGGSMAALIAGSASVLTALLAVRLVSTPRRARRGDPVAVSAESDTQATPPEARRRPEPRVQSDTHGSTIDLSDAPPDRGSTEEVPTSVPVDSETEVAFDRSRPVEENDVRPNAVLHSQAFLEESLRGRVAVARRALRPLSIVYLEVVEVLSSGRLVPVEHADVAAALSTTLRDSDIAGEAGDLGFACVLEDTGEDGAVWTAERLRRALADGARGRRFRAGVASYPTHGLEAEELQAKARSALLAARDWSRDRIEVAPNS